MSSRPSRVPRGQILAFLGVSLVLVAALVPGAILRGEVLSQSQLLFDYAPWQAHRPAGLPPVNTFLVDPPLVFYPFLVHAVESVHRWALPVWSTGIYAGHPFLASFQSAVCSPFTAIAYVAPLPGATVAMALAPLVVGALGMFVFVCSIGLGVRAAWFAGLAWLLNGFAIVWFEHPLTAVACWLPWLLVAGDRVAAQPDARRVAALAVAVALTVLAGHPETTLKVFLFTSAYAVTRLRGERRAAWLAVAAGYAAGLLLASVQVLPFAEYLRGSEALARRVASARNTFFMPVETIVTAVVPDFFGNPAHGAYLARVNRFGVAANYGEQQVYAGAVTVLLAPLGLLAGWRDRRLRFFAGAVVASLALMYGAPGLIEIVSVVPILRVSILSRFGLVAIASLIVLAAAGVHALTETAQDGERGARPFLVVGVTLAVLVVLVAASLAWLRGPLDAAGLAGSTARASAIAAGVLVLATLLVRARTAGLLGATAFTVGVCLVAAAEMSATAHGFHETVAPALVMPRVPAIDAVSGDKSLFRVYGWGRALLPNTAMAYALQDARGWDGVQPARYTRLLDLGYLRQDADPARHLADPSILDVLNVKYVFVPPGLELPAPRFRPVPGGDGSVYVNTRVLPRAFIVGQYRVMTDRELERALHSRAVDLSAVALLERELPDAERPGPIGIGEQAGEAVVGHYRETFVEVATEAPGRRLLVLGDAFYPGWEARVDGAPAPLHRADYALRLVPVPAGRHIVTFEYRPWSVRLGIVLSLLQAVVLVGAVLVTRRARRVTPR